MSPLADTETPAGGGGSDYIMARLQRDTRSVAESCPALRPHGLAHWASLTFVVFWSLPKFMSVESVMPSKHLAHCHLLLPSVFPTIRGFSNESVLPIRWPKCWGFNISCDLKVKVKVAQLCLTLRPHGLYRPWNSPGLNTGVGSLFLLQGIFPTQVFCIASGFFTS